MARRTRHWSLAMVDLTGSVYGTILASSVVVALGYKQGSALVMIGALAVTELVFTAAHAWSAVLTAGAARGGLPSIRDLQDAFAHEWPVLQATWPAVVALLIAAVGVYSTDTGVDVALVVNTVILVLWGLALARLQGAPMPVAVGAGALTGALGVVLIVLKLMVH